MKDSLQHNQPVSPYHIEGKSKKEEVEIMFDNISGKYDLLNRILSLGIDKRWRKKAMKILAEQKPDAILDVATGTADFAISSTSLNPGSVTGIDISAKMLDVGREKIQKAGLSELITLQKADSESIPFEDNKFDAVTVAFGVRNFENLDKGLSEMRRVLAPGGMVMVLEFSKPTKFPFKNIYWLYFDHILPLVGKLVSKDRSAYSYLPESVRQFPDGEAFLQKMQDAGFSDCKQKALTFGIASIYTGIKEVVK